MKDWFDKRFEEFLEDYERPLSRCMLTGVDYLYAGLYMLIRGKKEAEKHE